MSLSLLDVKRMNFRTVNYQKMLNIFLMLYWRTYINKAFKEYFYVSNISLITLLSKYFFSFEFFSKYLIAWSGCMSCFLFPFSIHCIFCLVKIYLNFSSIVWGWKEETESHRWALCNWDSLCWKPQVGLWGNSPLILQNLKLRHNLYKVFIKTIRASNLLSKQDMSILFINWKDLIVTNTKLLKSMRIRQSTNQQQATIGDILCENVKFIFSLFFLINLMII